MPTVCRKN